MWGDPERAASMEQGSDKLATLLFQISSPAHIPWGDQRWQEVLHGYDVWVHMDDSNPLMEQACKSMAKHAEMSSNLAALSLHVTRLLRDLAKDFRATVQSNTNDNANNTGGNLNEEEHALVKDFSKRISRVAKSRATAGALQLLRLLCHPVIVGASTDPASSVANLREVFTYHTRGDLLNDQPAGYPLMHSLLDLIAVLGTQQTTTTSPMQESSSDILRTPEMYDCAVFSFQLFFVLCGTQLYQPFQSSFEANTSSHYFLEELYRRQHDEREQDEALDNNNKNNNLQILWSSSNRSMSSQRSVGSQSTRSGSHTKRKAKSRLQRITKPGRRKIWTPKSILEICLEWQLHRPPAPERSISHYYYVLAKSAVDAKGGEKPGPDGLYENYMVVQAVSPNSENMPSEHGADVISTTTTTPDGKSSNGRNNLIVDTTKGILTLSGSIIFLPFRLMSLVYGVFSTSSKQGAHDLNRQLMMKKFAAARYSRTRDVLWLSDSLLADLGCSMVLFLVSNCRNGENSNAFRSQLKDLKDNRWNSEHGGLGLALPDLPNFSQEDEGSVPLESLGAQRKLSFAASSFDDSALTFNFESLFLSFGRTLHTELGALLLYTIIQSSPSFAESLAVRSDMDNLVMPLLRTLYFASRSNAFMAKDYAAKKRSSINTANTLDIRSCPFRTQSQLYVIIILLLLFSQDSSFGRDIFRRVIVLSVPWYKERNLKCINLGSVIILTLLRSLLFTMNRFNDVFLLNNCCAVLENISPSVADLHEYAAMRLISVTVSVMKKHAKLALTASHKKKTAEDERGDSPMDTHDEVAHTLLGLIKHGLSTKNIEGNIHLIYALVYHQVDFLNLSKTKYTVGTKKKKLYHGVQTNRITNVILKASELIREEGARSAPKALKVLEHQMGELKAVVVVDDKETMNKTASKNGTTTTNGSSSTVEDEFTFSYEEEADPEVFFVPYIWDIIVSVVTASNMEWKKNDIEAFALLEEVDDDGILDAEQNPPMPNTTGANFTNDADEMV